MTDHPKGGGLSPPPFRGGALALLAVLVAWGCGARSALIVARVQGRPITQDVLSHWMAIKRVALQGTSGPTSASAVQDKALAFLITADWLEGETAARGIRISESEVQASYRRLLSAPTGPGFAANMRHLGLSGADELRLLRLATLAQMLRASIATGGASPRSPLNGGRQRQLNAFTAAYRQRWIRRTSCRPGYVIAECGDRLAAGSSSR
jgi:hypothetical protein